MLHPNKMFVTVDPLTVNETDCPWLVDPLNGPERTGGGVGIGVGRGVGRGVGFGGIGVAGELPCGCVGAAAVLAARAGADPPPCPWESAGAGSATVPADTASVAGLGFVAGMLLASLKIGG